MGNCMLSTKNGRDYEGPLRTCRRPPPECLTLSALPASVAQACRGILGWGRVNMQWYMAGISRIIAGLGLPSSGILDSNGKIQVHL